MLQRCDAIIRFLSKDYKCEHKVEKHDKEYWLKPGLEKLQLRFFGGFIWVFHFVLFFFGMTQLGRKYIKKCRTSVLWVTQAFNFLIINFRALWYKMFHPGTLSPMIPHWDLLWILHNEGLGLKTERTKDMFAQIWVCSFILFYFNIVFCQVYPKDHAALQPFECNPSYKMCKESNGHFDCTQSSEFQEFWHTDEHALFFCLVFFCCLKFVAVLPFYLLMVGAAQGHHVISQWQQRGVIITICVKAFPIFHIGVIPVRKIGYRGFENN